MKKIKKLKKKNLIYIYMYIFLKRGVGISSILSDMWEFTVSVLWLEIEGFHRSFLFHAHCTSGDETHP